LHELLENVGLENPIIQVLGRQVNGFSQFCGCVPHPAGLGQGHATVKVRGGILGSALLSGMESLHGFEKTSRTQQLDSFLKLILDGGRAGLGCFGEKVRR
jgi:hypothetical protein